MHIRHRITSFARAAALALATFLLVGALAGPAQAGLPEGGSSYSHRRAREDRVESVLKAARSQLGTPYRYGGMYPGGFDCSGFTRWSWQHGGDTLPHNSQSQYYYVRKHVRPPNLEPGDLLFFYSPISHVAIFLGRNKMIEAPHSGSRVRIVRVYWQYFTAAARPR
jgi:cell wall-associated NlpC family hydrolase